MLVVKAKVIFIQQSRSIQNLKIEGLKLRFSNKM